jgi:DNA gyrase subunit A
VQADAILRMTLGQLVNLEQEKLAGEHRELLDEIKEYSRILSDERNILDMVRADLLELKRKHADERRTEISGEEIGTIDLEDLITEETMVVTISRNGYIKRTAASVYRAQRRGGKGLMGAKTDEEDPIQNLFVASTHDYLLFFTNQGRVYWQKVYDLPQLGRESRGRAVVNLLNLAPDEKIANCLPIRDFSAPEHYLVMATKNGLVKKTPLEQYGRPMKRGIIAINLREGDELVDAAVAKTGDEIVLSSARGQAIRFRQSAARPMGRSASGVRGIKLRAGDSLVGMVVANPDAQLLTVCAKGFGKRTPFGPNSPESGEVEEGEETAELETDVREEPADEAGDEADETSSSAQRYPTKGRGGLGVRDIKTTERNGPVVATVSVDDDDEVLMMTARGKIQRIRAGEIRLTGRNTQGVRIMHLEDDDTLVGVVCVPKGEVSEAMAAEVPPAAPPEVPEE